jgi:1,4-dihydroxy-2-naphthoyl-CoA synthase
MSEPVLTNLADNGVLTITLNRPEVLNSLDESLTLGLVDAMHEAKNDSAVSAVVITGCRSFLLRRRRSQCAKLASRKGRLRGRGHRSAYGARF